VGWFGRTVAIVIALAVASSVASTAAADDDKAARELFVKGGQLVKDADWAGALAAFEESSRLHAHPVTTFNIGACLRAMGQYARARKAFAGALEDTGQLGTALTDETRRYVGELDKLLAVLDLTITPEEAKIAIDGRPLEQGADGKLVAGVLPPGPAKAAPKGRFKVIVDPGVHIITIGRDGFADAVDRETFSPGQTVEKKLVLDRLPAQIHITSPEKGAQVLIDEADVGLTPVDINRPAGKYKVVVKKRGFLPFETTTSADPGQSVNVAATLREDKPTLTQRWWFWTGVGVVVVGAAVTTYFLTRPDPERPPVDGGGLGWASKYP